MNKIVSRTIMVLVIFLLSLTPQNYASSEQSRSSIGALLSPDALGFQTDLMISQDITLKFTGIYVYGLCVRQNEYIVTGALSPTYHLASAKSYLQPIIFAGISFSRHHWHLENSSNEKSGNINDLTLGGGGGLGYKITSNSKIGMNLWINYDYKTRRTSDTTKKGKRFFLPLFLLDYCYYF
jgi:hypothetical protein